MSLRFVKGTIFLCLSGVGIVGNIFSFLAYVHMFNSTKKKYIHLLFIHLAFTNSIMLLLKVTPKTLAYFGVENFLEDVGCMIFIYLERVTRGISICTTCLLTLVQAITISPRDSVWRKLKLQSGRHIFSSLLFFWILNSSISMNLLFHIKNISSMNTSQITRSEGYCYFLPGNLVMRWIFLALMVLRDAVFQGIMAVASGYMVFLLHQHHQHVLYLQRSKFAYKTRHEMKAVHSVLLLMLCFLFFYWTECVLSLFLSFFLESYFMMVNIQEFLRVGYAILSPFILIPKDRNVAQCWH
ncbi:putative vomeronasal receptor-like protein 4 [Perognathus longimembris pacificus]|uniref:putative vomeronasal receptor-like protein 4 n=1 Tax=Perognathus longimembris pacificus TaxID=214514 RepID=UPI0020198E12|nr:putative vomeronasal receptor-like protein 4 [Perognathus longimembris pacificus]